MNQLNLRFQWQRWTRTPPPLVGKIENYGKKYIGNFISQNTLLIKQKRNLINSFICDPLKAIHSFDAFQPRPN